MLRTAKYTLEGFYLNEIQDCVLNEGKIIAISSQMVPCFSGHTHSFDVQSKCPHVKCSGRDITKKKKVRKGVHFLYDVNKHGLHQSPGKPRGLTRLDAEHS